MKVVIDRIKRKIIMILRWLRFHFFSIFLTVCHENNILYGLEYTDITYLNRSQTVLRCATVCYGYTQWPYIRVHSFVFKYGFWWAFHWIFLKGTLALDKISSAWGRGFDISRYPTAKKILYHRMQNF